jgi:hypothetical protein
VHDLKKKEKTEFDSLVVAVSSGAQKAFEEAGLDDAEDMAQDVALRISAARLSKPKGKITQREVEEEAEIAIRAVVKDYKSRKRGLKLMDIENASSVPDVSTPYHYAVAREIAGAAIGLDLDCVMMGDTLEDEAQHYGVTRQRAHQIINEKREQMQEYLVD